MLINKIVGMILFMVGSILLFSLYRTGRHDIFLMDLLMGPTFIYIGLKMLNYF